MTTVQVNGIPVPHHPGDTLDALLASLAAATGADPTRPGIAVAVNDRVVPRSAWATTHVAPGDRVEVLHAIAGG
ncbi:MAG: sulfur carrier protein ThiS [Ardenticatenales bacterium]|nr:sulfur carrier protein ThiS [Ardenticatenales bacterium]